MDYAVFAILIWKVQAGSEDVSATTTLAMPRLERMPRKIPHGNHKYYVGRKCTLAHKNNMSVITQNYIRDISLFFQDKERGKWHGPYWRNFLH